MPLDKTSMAAKVKAKMAAIAPVQSDSAGTVQPYLDAQLEAMCDGIIEEIVQNGLVTTTSGAPDGEHIGGIT